MCKADLPNIIKIEQGSQVMPWTRDSFEESLNKEHYCRVIEKGSEDKSLVAFHIVCAVADELHILTLAVRTGLQGNGLGHVLMHDIIEYAESKKVKKIFLEVRASNRIAQNLYQKWQFKQIAIRKAYYRTSSNKREDALVYVRLTD